MHRVQRVPVTESQGRIHTSTTGVLVFPEVDEPEEVEINQNDLKIDVYRSSGPGGQSVNTTDSAVRITHLPTGIVVSMQNEKSQLQNKEAGMRVLRARILAQQQEEQAELDSAARKSQIRTMDRSRAHPHLQLPGEPDRGPPHRLQGVQPRRGDERRAGPGDPVLHRCRRGAPDRGDRRARLTAAPSAGSTGTVRKRGWIATRRVKPARITACRPYPLGCVHALPLDERD